MTHFFRRICWGAAAPSAPLICSRLIKLFCFSPLQRSKHSKVHLHPRTGTHPAAGLQGGGDGRGNRASWRGFSGPGLQASAFHHQLGWESLRKASRFRKEQRNGCFQLGFTPTWSSVEKKQSYCKQRSSELTWARKITETDMEETFLKCLMEKN